MNLPSIAAILQHGALRTGKHGGIYHDCDYAFSEEREVLFQYDLQADVGSHRGRHCNAEHQVPGPQGRRRRGMGMRTLARRACDEAVVYLEHAARPVGVMAWESEHEEPGRSKEGSG